MTLRETLTSRRSLNTEDTGDHRGKPGLQIPLCSLFPCGEDFALPSELHRHARARGDVGSGGGGLLAGEAAANRIELKAGVLGGFYGAAESLADE